MTGKNNKKKKGKDHSIRDLRWLFARSCLDPRRGALYSQKSGVVKIAAQCQPHCQKRACVYTGNYVTMKLLEKSQRTWFCYLFVALLQGSKEPVQFYFVLFTSYIIREYFSPLLHHFFVAAVLGKDLRFTSVKVLTLL